MIYSILSIVFLCLLTLQMLLVLIKIFSLGRQDRIQYVKGYKRGKCAYIYLITIPLVMLGLLYDGVVWYRALFTSIDSVVSFALLQFEFNVMANLMAVNLLYEITIYYAFTLICLNTILFVFSILGQFFFESIESVKFSLRNSDKLYIFGFNKNSEAIYESCDLKSKVIIDNFSNDDKFLLYVKKINYYSIKNFEDKIEDIFKIASRSDNKINVLINTQNDEKNVVLCKKFIDLLNEKYFKEVLFEKLNVIVYGNSSYESLYQEIEKNSKGIIKYVNKYKLIANDFVKKYPISYFLTNNELDYESATVKNDVDINFNIIGFGKTGIQLFLSSIENNQFITKVDGEIVLKKVNYHIYDQTNGESSKLLNHTYFRYVYDFDFTKSKDYLPLPEIPANHTFYKLNVNDTDFYKSIKITAEKNKKSVNFIAVTLSNDLENIDIAKKLTEKMREWGITNYYVFVKIRDSKNNYLVENDQNIYVIGNEDKIVYDVDEIINDEITKMAIKRNAVYDLEYVLLNEEKDTITESEYETSIKNSKYNWYANRLPFERNSNYSAVLSIRGKLNLIGYDLVVLDKDDYSSFIDDYSKSDTIEYHNKQGVKTKKIVSYGIDKFKPSLRRNFAILEHFRWNSFMIANGFIPATITEIQSGKVIKNGKEKYTNGKNYSVRKHGNLTTFKGLEQYSKILSERDNISLEKADVIRYDYQILDDVGWLISESQYKIIKK